MSRRIFHRWSYLAGVAICAVSVFAADTTSTSATKSTTKNSSTPKKSTKKSTQRPVSHSKSHSVTKAKSDTASYATSTAPYAQPVGATDHAAAAHKHAVKPKYRAPAVSPALRMAALAEVTDRMVVRQSHFENAAALVPFFELMTSAQRTGQAVHILQFGDSHTASDDWVNAMRVAFQARYGAGGPGFTLAGHPFKGYRRFDVSGSSSAGWVTEGTLQQMGDGRAGLGGISITAQKPGQTVSLTTSGDQLKLFYLQQPGGGALELFVDGRDAATIETDGKPEAGIYEYKPEPGQHEYLLRTTSALPVRLFGWASDSNKGMTVETLGINGAQASLMLSWDEAIWAAQIADRDPSLIILAYGTNEANSSSFDANEYRLSLRAVLERVRKAAPVASILMVGPPDCGRLHPLAHLDEVIQVQREVARETGAAFWDWRQHMGGPGATSLWVKAGLGQADHIHLTSEGYKLLGQTLFEELEMENSVYQSVRQPASIQTSL